MDTTTTASSKANTNAVGNDHISHTTTTKPITDTKAKPIIDKHYYLEYS